MIDDFTVRQIGYVWLTLFFDVLPIGYLYVLHYFNLNESKNRVNSVVVLSEVMMSEQRQSLDIN